MATRRSFVLTLLAFAQGIHSVAFPGPKATVTPVVDDQGVTPKPTQSPEINADLKKRYVALEWYCGWWSAGVLSSSSPASCDIGTCNFWPGPGGTTLQGCCDIGSSYCTFPTTCYDYKASLSGSCNYACQYSNNAVTVCDSYSPYCNSYSYWNGAIGYGCAKSSISTWVSVTSTIVSFTSITSTALVPSLAQNAFSFTSGSKYTSTYRPYTATGSSGGYSGGGLTYTTDTAVLTAAALVPLIVVLVIWGLWYLCALGVVIYMCRRSKRLVAAWYQPGGALNKSGATPAGAVAPQPTNIMAPAPMYYTVPAPGTPGSYMSPQSTGTVPTPGAGVSPPAGQAQPYIHHPQV